MKRITEKLTSKAFLHGAIKLITANLSFLMIATGAAAFLLANVALKSVLDAEAYGQYSILVTYLSVVYIFGLCGFEQVFLRFSDSIGKNLISSQPAQFRICLSIVLVSSVAATFGFQYFYGSIGIGSVLLFAATLLMISSLMAFNILRLNHDFFAAQLTANLWKVFLFVIAAALYVYDDWGLGELISFLLWGVILISGVVWIYILRKIRFEYHQEVGVRKLLLMAFNFFLSIGIVTVLLFGDRFIIEQKFDFEELGNYFYLTNFFLAPFSIIQGYVGFKQLIFFKTSFNLEAYGKANKRTALLGLLLGIVLAVLAAVLYVGEIVHLDLMDYKFIILLLLVLGVIRLLSSSITAAFEAKTTVGMLVRSNLWTICVSLPVLYFAMYFAENIGTVIICYMTLWLFRLLVQHGLIRKTYFGKTVE